MRLAGLCLLVAAETACAGNTLRPGAEKTTERSTPPLKIDAFENRSAEQSFEQDSLALGLSTYHPENARAEDAEAPQAESGDVSRDIGKSVWEDPRWHDQPVAVRTEDKAESKTVTKAEPGDFAIPVLCYHQNFDAPAGEFAGYNVPPDALEAQLAFLKTNGYASVSLAEFQRALTGDRRGLPERPVLLTFDDGLLSNYTVVRPLLQRYGFRAVLFLYPAVLHGRSKHYMNEDQVRELLRSGLVELGAHGVYHDYLPRLKDGELERRLTSSKEILERKFGVRISAFAYPFGVYDRRVMAAVRRAGFSTAFTINTGVVEAGDDPLALNRYMVVRSHGVDRFAAHLKLRGPRELTLQPADGSHIRAGQALTLYLPGARGSSVLLKLNGNTVTLEQQGDIFRGTVSGEIFKNTGRGYLPGELRLKDETGKSYYRRFLYLDADRFQ